MQIALNEEDKTEKDTITEAGILERQLDKLKRSKHTASRMTVKVNDKIFGETISSEWTNGNEDRKPRNVSDAWSCLLFDIAIEPLSNTLIKSDKLAGFSIPGTAEKLKTTLFADDTTMYMNGYDTGNLV